MFITRQALDHLLELSIFSPQRFEKETSKIKTWESDILRYIETQDRLILIQEKEIKEFHNIRIAKEIKNRCSKNRFDAIKILKRIKNRGN